MTRLKLLPLMAALLLVASAPATSACGTSTEECCRVCRVGKPCGDTCIEQSDTCHVGSGCACQG